MLKRVFVIAVLLMPAIATIALAATPAYDLAPGYYAKFNLHYKVHYTWHGDSLKESSSIEFDTGEGHVVIATVLGNDQVDLVVTVNGKTDYSTMINHQQGKCIFGCDTEGTITVEVNEDCDGTIRIVYGGEVIDVLSGDPSHAITILEDGKASLIAKGSWTSCGGARPPDLATYSFSHGSPIIKYALLGGVAVALIALAVAVGGGRHG